MFSFAQSPQPLFKRMQDSFALYKQSLSKVWYLAFILMLFSSIPNFHSIFTGAPMGVPGKMSIHPVAFFIFLVVLIFVSSFITAVILHRMHAVGIGKTTPLATSLHLAREKLLTIVAAIIIIACAVFVAGSIGALILSLIPGLRGTVLFVLPVVYLMVLFVFYLPYIVLKDAKVFQSIEQSVRSVWKHWWDTFLILLPPIAAIFLVQFITIQFDKTNMVAQLLINIIIIPLLQPWFTAAILVQFKEAQLTA